MITGSNLLAEYPRIPQNILPKELQQEEFDFIAENFDLIDEDEDIGKCADTFIELLNFISILVNVWLRLAGLGLENPTGYCAVDPTGCDNCCRSRNKHIFVGVNKKLQ